MSRIQKRLADFMTRSWSHDAAILLIRVWLGSMMIKHGYGKIFGENGIDKFANGVADMGFPLPELFAWAAALSEFAGGIFLIVGLLTRPTALMVATTMFVAAFVKHIDDPWNKQELPITFLVMAIALFIAGPGRFAVDRLLFRRGQNG